MGCLPCSCTSRANNRILQLKDSTPKRPPVYSTHYTAAMNVHKNVHTGSRIHANVHSMYIPRTCLQAHTDPCTDRVQISYEESYI